ncbi:hypothetical protein [Fictibacillus phosphorivorans]|uniref:hypothetical protein n=1 Tax=Fictibacillus phosphorivorans TaxID=1221500 RepID=UPI00129389FC|nr:hypothetical protein [Fictibacillus phosphorivorans]MQR94622.1 hypothetical protein [Fictibacillus phosphorivorans]
MNRIVIKGFSAVVGIVALLGLMAFYFMTNGQLADLTSSIFWFGYVGLILTIIYGITVSFFIEWLLKKSQRSKVGYNISFILYHVLAGTVIPILGNIVSFFFAVAHLLIQNGKTKELLFFFVWMVSLVVTGVMLESKLTQNHNMQMIHMTPFLVLLAIGILVIGFSTYLLLSGKWMLKVAIFLISTCSVFLPSTMNLLEAHEEFNTRYKQDSELAILHDKIKDRYSDLELDLISSNDNVETLDLTIHKHSVGFSVLQIEKLINDIPVREAGFSLQLYEKEEFLNITVDLERKVTECEASNTEENICGELLRN